MKTETFFELYLYPTAIKPALWKASEHSKVRCDPAGQSFIRTMISCIVQSNGAKIRRSVGVGFELVRSFALARVYSAGVVAPGDPPNGAANAYFKQAYLFRTKVVCCFAVTNEAVESISRPIMKIAIRQLQSGKFETLRVVLHSTIESTRVDCRRSRQFTKKLNGNEICVPRNVVAIPLWASRCATNVQCDLFWSFRTSETRCGRDLELDRAIEIKPDLGPAPLLILQVFRRL